MDWFTARVQLLVRELGTTQFREITSPKTKTHIELQIQETFFNQKVSVVSVEGRPLKTEQDFASLTNGQRLEVAFAGKVTRPTDLFTDNVKFYWVPSSEQVSQWKAEFMRALEPGQTKLRGDQARAIFLPNPRVSQQWIQDLYTIWCGGGALSSNAYRWLADIDKDNMLNLSEYILAKFLIFARENSITIPRPLPQSLLDSVLELNGALVEGDDMEGEEETSHPWVINQRSLIAYRKLFSDNKTLVSGTECITANLAPSIFSRSGLDVHTLSKIWDLADTTRSGNLSEAEFCVAMHLVASAMKGTELPSVLPIELKTVQAQLRQDIRGSSSRFSSSRVKEHKRAASEERVSFAIGGLNKSPISVSEHTSDVAPSPSPTSGSATPISGTKIISPFLAPPNPFQQPPSPPSASQSPAPIPIHPQQSPQAQPQSQPPQSQSPQPQQPQTQPQTQQPQAPHPQQQQQQQQPVSYNPFSQPQQPVDMNKFNFQSTVVAQRQKDIVKDVAMGLVQQHKALHFPPAARGVSPSATSASDKQVDLHVSGVPRVDDTEIEREAVIGKGTFGSVWRGTMKATGEVVAIKDMPYPSKKEVEMWKKEVQLLSKLVNDNYLVKLKGYCITQKHLTIIMEFMDGGSLYEVIHGKNSPVPWSMLRKVRILRHIAKGIESIHNKNIVHRDLKSMNILLDSKGTAKLADLGCSRVISEEARLTLTLGVGSPLWMAPEVHSGSYSFPSDVFSYGVVTFEVFNEKLPDFNPAKRCVVIPEDCIGYPVIKRCTELDPRLRPTSHGLIDMMDTLIATFTTTVARVIRMSYKGDDQLPTENEIDTWYKMFLSYDRDTFDVLLSTGLNTLH